MSTFSDAFSFVRFIMSNDFSCFRAFLFSQADSFELMLSIYWNRVVEEYSLRYSLQTK